MGTRTETFFRCDRCGHEELSNAGLPDGWGRVAAERKGYPDHIGGATVATDLCSACTETLMEWWRAPGGPLVQPAPPPPPPPPVFTIEHRRLAVADAAEALEEQVRVAFAIVREEPTSILSESIVPGALAGVSAHAEQLVDRIIDRLGFGSKRRSRQSGERHDAPPPFPADTSAMPAAAPIPASPGACL